MMTLLLDAGININHINRLGSSPLIELIKLERIGLVMLLIDRGADVTITNKVIFIHITLVYSHDFFLFDYLNLFQKKETALKLAKKLKHPELIDRLQTIIKLSAEPMIEGPPKKVLTLFLLHFFLFYLFF